MNEFVETVSSVPIPLEELNSFPILQLEEKSTDEVYLKRGCDGPDVTDSEPPVKEELMTSIPYVFSSCVPSSGFSALTTKEPLDRALVDVASTLAVCAAASEPELSDSSIAPPFM
ncbi:uncharacterized protein TM35_000221430 [Trypanosoma theileri]|uniref:Uncharacterized protein n=1 Tax=Trypanosoma theileri TaxID=67003 RepID=A0A1X0NRM4_9TRYP|nr:uncharacterized protein TM35_000221430 [Trypanosoma theileri]ORC87344.1 hypothetical protein TM35_000221430 [Trypanosoma theileri]